MNSALSVIEGEIGQMVSAKELHRALAVESRFADWIKRRIEKYGFEPGVDWIRDDSGELAQSRKFYLKQEERDEEGNLIEAYPEEGVEDEDAPVEEVKFTHGGKRARAGDPTDYFITMDMAKELAMVEANDIGRKVRKYFIKVEKAWNNPGAILLRAQQMGLAAEKIATCVVDAVAEIGEEMLMRPFPNSMQPRPPDAAWRIFTKNGGRVYILSLPKRKLLREVLVFAPNGRFLVYGMVNVNRQGEVARSEISKLLEPYKTTTGVLWTYDYGIHDYTEIYKWRVALLKERIEQGLLPAPEETKALEKLEKEIDDAERVERNRQEIKAMKKRPPKWGIRPPFKPAVYEDDGLDEPCVF